MTPSLIYFVSSDWNGGKLSKIWPNYYYKCKLPWLDKMEDSQWRHPDDLYGCSVVPEILLKLLKDDFLPFDKTFIFLENVREDSSLAMEGL